ncbi:MAG: hypothetical protein WCF85_16995 [Rhodospirillaceae bacterium]
MRHPDWPVRLDRFLAERRDRPFAWGVHDCSLFVLDWIEQATGTRPFDPRGLYHDQSEAAVLLHKHWNTDDLITVATGLLGQPLVTSMLAGRGDVLAFQRDKGVWLGLCVGSVGVAVGRRGLVTLPLSLAIYGWRL